MSTLPPSTFPSHADAAVAAFIAQLKQQLEAQAEQLNAQQQLLQSQTHELDYARLKICVLEERLRRERIARYGKR